MLQSRPSKTSSRPIIFGEGRLERMHTKHAGYHADILATRGFIELRTPSAAPTDGEITYRIAERQARSAAFLFVSTVLGRHTSRSTTGHFECG